MISRQIPRCTLLFAVVGMAALSSACDRPPSVELKEWSPADHEGEKKAGENAKQGARGESSETGRGAASLVDITWRNQCASCHGPQGKGDGPQGPMFKAPDLGRADWQARVKDDEIAATIQNGKGRMPKFDLPDEIVRGLVTRVRSFREQ
ncbi:MAG: cytochrome c [Myxococcales bacterium]|nr:cytochrome c [Myxococcales bacterium]